MSRLERTVNVDDVRALAKRRLPRAVYEVISGGAGDETTLAANRADLDRIELVPRALEDVADVDLSTTILGQDFASPILLAPASFARMCHPMAERAVAIAAAAARTGYIVPGGASDPVERIASASSAPLWYQIYLAPDPSRNAALLDRVKAHGYRTLVVSVDTPMKPYRERDMRNGMSVPLRVTPRLAMTGMSRPKWAFDFVFGGMASGFSISAGRDAYYSFESAMSTLRPVTLADVAWLRERWSGPLVVKGILSDERIRDLVALGVDGVSVSNHGGRNLDGVTSAIKALPRIVEAGRGDLEVFVDGGIRRGTDVVRALALGAKAVLIGRPYMYGLAAGGAAGVAKVISLLLNELRIALAFSGVTSVSHVDRTLLADADIYRSPRVSVPSS